jgi:nucleotide-binding universal stress UspA family protein
MEASSRLWQEAQEASMNTILEQVTTTEAIPGVADVNIQKIIVPVDLSKHSEKTAAYAVALAKAFGASIIFLHVFPPEVITEFETEDIHRSYTRECDAAKEKLLSFGKKYPHCETEFRIGDTPEEVRLAAVQWNADLIVTASYHPGFLGRLLGLERAPQIVKRAPCPVVVYHEMQE